MVDTPVIIARTGWTTDELDKAIDEAHPQGPFSLVSLLIGVNNQYRGRSVDEYRREFRALLGRAIGFAGGRPGHVMVLSIPDWGVTPFAEGRDRARIGSEIDSFNEVNRQEAMNAGAHYLDITPISRDAKPSYIASDGLHPSGTMYAEWATLALPVAQQILQKGN
jgi:lysophospholipase L1-like esterase